MIDRRSLLLKATATLLASPAWSQTSGSQDRIALWPGEPPGGGGPRGAVDVSRKGAVSNVVRPELAVVRPDKPNGAAVLVAAGGGYRRISMANEAFPATSWLVAYGITVFVLTYRLPAEGWTAGPLAPLQDAQRAIRLIRSNAHRYGIDPDRLGVLGFSAGGHLLGMAAARSAFRSYPPVDAADDLSARPSAAALIYPVISLEPPYDQTATRRSLIGDHPGTQAAEVWSVQTHVRAGCPPIFLVQAADDPIVDPANSEMMAKACRDASVPVEFDLLASGGHGFGMGRSSTPSAAWPGFYANWLHRLRLIG